MQNNVGQTDRHIRTGLGAVSGALSLAILAEVLPASLSPPMIASPILGVVAIVLLVTAFTEKCGLYSVLGINTCEVRGES